MARTAKPTYSDMMQAIVAKYRDAGEEWPTSSRVIALWAIRNKHWDRGERTLVDMCARELAKAMREEYHTDPQGRRVRTKHAAKFPAPGTETGQTTLWDDIRNAPREFMERAFNGRRGQIVGDCIQLSTDVNSFNDNSTPTEPIELLLDFRDDVAESRQRGETKVEPPASTVQRAASPFDAVDLATVTIRQPGTPAALPLILPPPLHPSLSGR